MLKAAILVPLTIICRFGYTSSAQPIRCFRANIINDWDDNPFKFLVLLRGDMTCTGSIFSSNMVITAARCFSNQESYPKSVGLESINPAENSTNYVKIDRLFLQKQLTIETSLENHNKDSIVMVKLAAKIEPSIFSHKTLIASLDDIGNGRDVLIVGYGREIESGLQQGALSKAAARVENCPSDFPKYLKCTASGLSEEGIMGAAVMIENRGQFLLQGFQIGYVNLPSGIKHTIFVTFKETERWIIKVVDAHDHLCITVV